MGQNHPYQSKGHFLHLPTSSKILQKGKRKNEGKKDHKHFLHTRISGRLWPLWHFQMGSKRTHKRIGQRLHPRRHPCKRHCAGNYRNPPKRYRSPRKRIRRLQQRAPYSHCRRNRRTGSFSGKRLIQSHYRSNHSL